MIYLDHTTDSQEMMIPRSYPAVGLLTLELKNTTDKEIVVRDVADQWLSDLYHHIAITLPEDADPGEWEYTLKDAQDTILSQGLVMIVEMDYVTAYEKSIEYEQYDE